MVTRPLEGLRVVDFTRFVAGPQVTLTLAAMGAEVIKLEVPPGDPYRSQGTALIAGQSTLFLALNAGKRSVALDVRVPECAGIVDDLLETADFFVENSRPGSLARYSLDYESIHRRHPWIVYGSISGYGAVGPDAGKGGFDLILQAESGLMSITGDPSSGPVKVGVPVLDVGAGMACVAGLLAAHVERLRTGSGTHVSTSLLEFALSSMTAVIAAHFAGADLPGLLGSHSPTFAPYGGFRTQDGWIVLAGAGSEEMWKRCCAALDVDHLVEDERFHDNAARVAHRDELTEELERVLRSATSEQWLATLAGHGVPAAAVKNLAEVLASDQVAALGVVQHLEHPAVGEHAVVAPPIHIDGEALSYQRTAPELGADTRSILRELGRDDALIDDLVARKVAVAP